MMAPHLVIAVMGIVYGWVTEGNPNTALARNAEARDRGVSADQRLDTFIHMQRVSANPPPPAFGAWKIQLPDGEYVVQVSVGDPDGANLDSTHRINVEGATIIAGHTPTIGNLHASATAIVTVSDGELNLDAAGGTNTKINYIHIIENIPGLAFPFDIPNLGTIEITADAPQVVYTIPGGEVVQVNGTDLVLPEDADGNGIDTYTITGITTFEGQTWYSIFLGSAFFVWLPAEPLPPGSATEADAQTVDDDTPDFYGIVNTSFANIRSGDDVAYTSLGTVSGGTILTILGRNADRSWWYVSANGVTGWINGVLIILRGNLLNVPVQDVDGVLIEATILLFADTYLYSITNNLLSSRICLLPGGAEYPVVGQTQDGVWYQIEAICAGTARRGFVQSESGAFRNPSGFAVPIVN